VSSSAARVQVLASALGEGASLVLVGGAVRDRLLGRPGGDWDLATALMPDTVMARARKAGLRCIPTGLQHGTVTVLVEGTPFEITTFRGDGDYLDGRRPESVRLGVALEEDLARRDFTVNAIALPVVAMEAPDWRDALVDPFGGQADLEAGILRAVGDPLVRFQEDGLRPYRACRFAAQLGFQVEAATLAAIPARLDVASKVAVERVFIEVGKLLLGRQAAAGLRLLEGTGLMDLAMPELRPLVGCTQNRYHVFDAWEHTLRVVEAAPAEPPQRWAALLHDVGKPGTRTVDEAGEAHFYNHEARSLDLAEALLRRLRASHALMDAALALVRHHGNHPTAEWSDGACRRLLKRLAADHLSLEAWGAFRLADQLGKGMGEEPFRTDNAGILARLDALAQAATALSVKDLQLDGRAIMRLLGRPGGPWLGQLQSHLLDRVLEDPALNTPEGLSELVRGWQA